MVTCLAGKVGLTCTDEIVVDFIARGAIDARLIKTSTCRHAQIDSYASKCMYLYFSIIHTHTNPLQCYEIKGQLDLF